MKFIIKLFFLFVILNSCYSLILEKSNLRKISSKKLLNKNDTAENPEDSFTMKYKDLKFLHNTFHRFLQLCKSNRFVLKVLPEKSPLTSRQKEINENISIKAEKAENSEFKNTQNSLKLKQKNVFENDELFQSDKINNDLKKEILEAERG